MTGATITSTAVKEAAAAALTAAGLDPENFKVAAAKPEGDQNAEETVLDADVVVVGAGGAGMTAAVTAASEGKTVVIVESQAMDWRQLCACYRRPERCPHPRSGQERVRRERRRGEDPEDRC